MFEKQISIQDVIEKRPGQVQKFVIKPHRTTLYGVPQSDCNMIDLHCVFIPYNSTFEQLVHCSHMIVCVRNTQH